MTLEGLRKMALALPHATEDMKWGNDLCMCVGGKIFLTLDTAGSPPGASFKTTPQKFGELIERDGFIPAPYVARNHWIFVENLSRVSAAEWKLLVIESYELIVAKLPARFRPDKK